MVVVTSASAWLRLGEPPGDCQDWPVCRVEAAPGAATEPRPVATPSEVERAVRAVHRSTASAALLVCLALVVVCFRRRAADPPALGLAVCLLVVALALSALGVVTPGSPATSVLLGNMLGGQLMLGLAWRLARQLDAPEVAGSSRGLTWWAGVAAVLWAGQAALGATSGAAGSISVSLAHMGLALPPGLCALGAAQTARGLGLRGEAAALWTLVPVHWGLGLVAAASEAAVLEVMLHNLSAALSLALLIGLIGRGRSTA